MENPPSPTLPFASSSLQTLSPSGRKSAWLGSKAYFPSLSFSVRKQGTERRPRRKDARAFLVQLPSPGQPELLKQEERTSTSPHSHGRLLLSTVLGLFLLSHFAKIFAQRLLSLTHGQQQTGAPDSPCSILQGDGSDNVHLASAQIM